MLDHVKLEEQLYPVPTEDKRCRVDGDPPQGSNPGLPQNEKHGKMPHNRYCAYICYLSEVIGKIKKGLIRPKCVKTHISSENLY